MSNNLQFSKNPLDGSRRAVRGRYVQIRLNSILSPVFKIMPTVSFTKKYKIKQCITGTNY